MNLLTTLTILSASLLFVGFLFVAPGLAVLRLTLPALRLDPLETIAVAAGLGLAIYPLLVLWMHIAGIQSRLLLAFGPGVLGLLALAWLYRPRRGLHWSRLHPEEWVRGQRLAYWGLFFLLLLILGIRIAVSQSMLAPAWGDSVQHTLIVRLFNEQGGLFGSWAPYAPMQSFTYHFGFHAIAAAWDIFDAQPTESSVLVAAQVLNGLAVLALYPIARRVTRSLWGSATVLLVAGLLSPVPAFYVNYGRYTQMTAQIFLPLLIWAFDCWWMEGKRLPLRFLVAIVLLAAALTLTHYRVATVGVLAALAWALWALWRWRRQPREWVVRTGAILLAGLGTLALIAPWFAIVREGRLGNFAAAVAQPTGVMAESYGGEIAAWNELDQHYPRYLWGLGAFSLLVMLWRRWQYAIPLGIWMSFVFLTTNPNLVGLPGVGWITNFLLILGLYIPLSLAVGWLVGAVADWLARWSAGRLAALAVILACAVFGLGVQAAIVDPSYQMVTANDKDAFAWIDAHVPPDARFLVNGFLAYSDSLVVGSDAGWWLPFYTKRANTVPPILYTMELLTPDRDVDDYRQFESEVRASAGAPEQLRDLLCHDGVSHVYLGDRAGTVGAGATPTVPAQWLQNNPDFQLLYQIGKAQVWAFDRSACGVSIGEPALPG